MKENGALGERNVPEHIRTGSYLLARAAISTDASKHSIYDLNETQDEFNSTKSQEDREESYIPLHDVLGLPALGPGGGVQEVPVGKRGALTGSPPNGSETLPNFMS